MVARIQKLLVRARSRKQLSIEQLRRRASALLVAALLAMIGAPALHLIGHKSDHTHVGDRIIRHAKTHSHGRFSHTHHPSGAENAQAIAESGRSGSHDHSDEPGDPNGQKHEHTPGGIAHLQCSLVVRAQFTLYSQLLDWAPLEAPERRDQLFIQCANSPRKSRAPPCA